MNQWTVHRVTKRHLYIYPSLLFANQSSKAILSDRGRLIDLVVLRAWMRSEEVLFTISSRDKEQASKGSRTCSNLGG